MRSFADHVQRAAAARAVAALDVDQHLIARQMRRQRAMIAVGPASRRGSRAVSAAIRRILRGLVRGDGLLQILQPELQLIGAQLLGAAAELVAQQALDQQPQLVVLGVQFARAAAAPSRSICCSMRGSSGRASRSICTLAMMNDAAASAPAFR